MGFYGFYWIDDPQRQAASRRRARILSQIPHLARAMDAQGEVFKALLHELSIFG
jgi:hypothetical protein